MANDGYSVIERHPIRNPGGMPDGESTSAMQPLVDASVLAAIRSIWPLLPIVVLLLVFGLVGGRLLASAGVAASAEARWSLARDRAVTALLHYSDSTAADDMAGFQAAYAELEGAAQAHRALNMASVDMTAAVSGLRSLKLSTDDIERLVSVYPLLRGIPAARQAIVVWGDSTMQVTALGQAAAALQDEVENGQLGITERLAMQSDIRAVDAEMIRLARTFSGHASQLSLQLQWGLGVALATTCLLLFLVAMTMLLRSRREMVRLQLRQREDERHFRHVIEGGTDGFWAWDRRSGAIHLSPRLRELLGISPSRRVTMQDLLMRLASDQRLRLGAALRARVRHGQPFDVELRCRARHEDLRWLRLRGQLDRGSLGHIRGLSGTITDIDDRKQLEASWFSDKERARVTLGSIGDGIISTDDRGIVEYLNPVAEMLTGWHNEDARGREFSDVCRIVDDEGHPPSPDSVATVLRTQRRVESSGQSSVRHLRGSLTPVDESVVPIIRRDGSTEGAIVVLRDASFEREYAATLSYQASHDQLTHLYNRAEIDRRIDMVLSSEGGDPCVLLYLDLDQFKLINDTAGHAAGDELLLQLSGLLRSRLRDRDVIARLGGDEFAILLQNCNAENAVRVAESLRRTIADQGFVCGGRTFRISASIGVVNLGAPGQTAGEVMRIADSACYISKNKGRNRVHVWRPDDLEMASQTGEMEWVGRLHAALAGNHFRLYRQDIASLGSRHGEHFEVLLRLQDGDSLVPPGSFIPSAERYGLMSRIDRWVISNTFALLQQSSELAEGRIDTVAINLSGMSVDDEGFVDFVIEQFARYRIPPRLICFELTETAAIGSLSRATAFMEQLKCSGCRFALDDFGVGMSSFSYLKNLPVDYLKIDGSFVRNLKTDPIDFAMVEAMNRIGHVLGKATVAEFVEDGETLEILRRIGVDYVQGYGIAMPRPMLLESAENVA